MLKKRVLFVTVALAALVCAAAPSFPIPVHAGKIEGMKRVSDPQIFVDITEALVKDERNPVDIVPDWQRREVPPEPEKVFVIFTVTVLQGRSISTADYLLVANNIESKCLAIKPEQADVYDPRRFKVKGPAIVNLLFTAPEKAESANLQPAPGFPLSEVNGFVLIEKIPEPDTPPPQPEKTQVDNKSPENAKPNEAKPAAPKDAKPVAKPAGKADAKPAAKPAGKASAKPAAKPAGKGDAKPAAKPAPKPAAKPAPKPAPKAAEEEWF